MTLNKYLQENKMTKSSFAALVGVSPTHISDITRGKVKPSLELAVLIQEETKGSVTPRDLVDSYKQINSRSELLQPVAHSQDAAA